MNRRRGEGRSSSRRRRDRYGVDEDEGKFEDEDVVTPYQLATDEATPAVGVAEAADTAAPAAIDPEPIAEENPSTGKSFFSRLGEKSKKIMAAVNSDFVADESEPLTPRNNNNRDIFRDEPEGGEDDDDDDDESLEGYDMTLQELIYSTSSFYAIVVPGKFLRIKLQLSFPFPPFLRVLR
jgi:hypothetical protein